MVNGLPFYSSTRIRLTSAGQIPDKNEETIGIKTIANVIKNKVGPSKREVEFPLYWDFGVNDEISIMSYLSDKGIITGTAWRSFTFKDQEYKWQGTAKWVELMRNPEFRKYVLDKVEELMVKKFEQRPDEIDLDKIKQE